MLYVVVCAAGPAPGVRTLIAAARAEGWRVYVIATPGAVAFLDVAAIEAGGVPVFSEYRRPDQEKRQPPADAAIVAPATYNTINKWAQGISDTLALGLLNEAIGLGLPMIAAPWPNSALASHPVFVRSIGALREWGVTLLFDPNQLPSAAASPRGDAPAPSPAPAPFPWDQLRALLPGLRPQHPAPQNC